MLVKEERCKFIRSSFKAVQFRCRIECMPHWKENKSASGVCTAAVEQVTEAYLLRMQQLQLISVLPHHVFGDD